MNPTESSALPSRIIGEHAWHRHHHTFDPYRIPCVATSDRDLQAFLRTWVRPTNR